MKEKEFLILDKKRRKPIGKVIIWKKVNWWEYALTESHLVEYAKGKKGMIIKNPELESFFITKREKRINYPDVSGYDKYTGEKK